jgi:upstream-binding transcription factor
LFVLHPLVKSLVETDKKIDDKGKGNAGKERKNPCLAYILWWKDQWNKVRL